MAPRGQTLPNATTESAREARKSFYCELCQKGYSRMNEFEAHEGSYDHQHKKRLKEMRQLTKDPNAAAKARAEERRANEEAGIKTINLSLAGSGTTKKKPVFKSIAQPQNAGAAAGGAAPSLSSISALSGGDNEDPSEAIRNGWANDKYDPRYPTGCDDDCPGCHGKAESMCLI